MTKPTAWFLLGSLMISLMGCGGGDNAANPPGTPAQSAAPNDTAATANPTAATPAKPAVTEVKDISPFIHHSEGDVALAIARPGRALVNPIVTGIIKEMDAADPTDKVEDRLKSMQEELGLDPRQVEYVVVSLSPATLNAFSPPSPDPIGPPGEGLPPTGAPQPEGDQSDPNQSNPNNDEIDDKDDANAAEGQSDNSAPPPAGIDAGGPPPEFNFEPPPSPALLVRLSAPIDGEAFIAQMAAREKAQMEKFMSPPAIDESMPKEFQEEMKKQNEQFRAQMAKESEYHRTEHAGVAMHQKGESKDRISFLNSQTLIFAPEAIVKSAIDRKGVAPTTPLTAQLQSLQDRDVALTLDITPLSKLMQSGNLNLPFPAQLFLGPILKCKYLSLAADIQGGHLLQVNLVAADEAGAKQLHGMLNPLLLDSIKKGKAAKNDANIPPSAAAFIPLGEQLLDGTSLTQTGDSLSLVVTRPASLGDLPTLVKPLIADAVEQKKNASSRNDLKQIGLGMHNYNDSNISFPANDQSADGKVGLSWRVHILPYVDEAPLYQEFHMDEPWDSDHNKTLIARMPKVYGTSREGKTSIHVFVGEGTPFGGKPPKIQDITDGTSNTIMVVRAGEDTAEIWTKPGGLPFDKANPIQALGNIGEKFGVLFMDASARELPKTIDATTLGNLIQHQDGNSVELP